MKAFIVSARVVPVLLLLFLLAASLSTANASALEHPVGAVDAALRAPLASPNLTLVLDHSPSGARVKGRAFTWMLHVVNYDSGGASFTNGQVLLRDDLPTGPTYGSPAVQFPVNITNSDHIGCTIAAQVLTCSANGDTVTVGVSGSFSVAWTVTPQTMGTLVNPAGSGICRVDPNGAVSESNETDNDCAASVVVNAQAASLVLGQADFAGHGLPMSQSGMSGPSKVVVDPTTGKVFVTDTNNHRVLRFGNGASLANGANAEAVFGQGTLETGAIGTGQTGMRSPYGIYVDGEGRLWVADMNNNRVLRFDQASSRASGASADGLLGQSAWNDSGYATERGRMYYPDGVFVDSTGRLWVADSGNNRVLRFDNAAGKSNGADADGVLGQTLYTTKDTATSHSAIGMPDSVWVDAAGRLWVTDDYSCRVLRFDNAASKSGSVDADGELGQVDFDHADCSTTSQSSLSFPSGLTVSPDGRLFVGDYGKQRVVWFENAAAKGNGAAADGLLGQPDWTSHAGNNGGISEASLASAAGVFYDPRLDALWIAEQWPNNRVMRFGTFNMLLPLLRR